MTTITDTVLYADGTTAKGSIVVTWPPFQFAGVSVFGGQTEFEVGAGGKISFTLYPNVGAQPVGTYYTAAYKLDRGPVYREYWVVPSSPPTVSIGSIRTIPEMPQ